MIHLSIPKFRTIAVFQTLLFLSASADVNIKLKPLMGAPDGLEDDFAGLFFEPYAPTPTDPRSCYDYCPCNSPGSPSDTCDCDAETVCGGSFPVDLSSNNKISFHWDASSNDTKYISIQGNGRTRVEFQGTVNCSTQQEQEITGSDITFEIDDSGLESVATQKYEYNADKSFIILGKCDGCSECEIYTRLQFDPKDGVLDLNLKSIEFSASYDSQKVLAGEQDFKWGTNMYCWMRDSSNRRLNRNRALEKENTYEILDLPSTDGDDDGDNASVTANVHGATILTMLIVGTMIFFA